MTEQLTALLIGGALSLAGVLIGGLLSFGLEIIRRRWAVSDRKYERKKQLVDRRCDQAEGYVQAMTQDYRHLLRDIELYLRNPDPQFTEMRTQSRNEWLDRWDTRIFSLGPAIRAIDHDEMKASWSELIDNMEEIQQTYVKVCDSILGDGEVLDADSEIAQANKLWIQYSASLGDFYSHLDDARYQLTET